LTKDPTPYIDGFVLPVPKANLAEYKGMSSAVAQIWKEHGAISYSEFVADDETMPGTLSFSDLMKTDEDNVLIFGWVLFQSKLERDLANERVAADLRMTDLVAPLTQSSRIIFDAKKMAFGGFKQLVAL
jgi:uncharacterized protein YbaA (DUF1428 family)